MKNLSIFLILLACSSSMIAQKNRFADNLESTKVTIERLKKSIPQYLKKSDVPGMSIALVRNGKLVWMGSFGVTNSKTKEPVTNKTIFEAASLSKPVVAYAVLKLFDEGRIDLDTPLNKYLGNNYDVGDDERLNLITARRVLSHTSGFPNWRNRNSKRLPINFTPGTKFSYSGEGFVYLSKVVEKITAMKFDKFIEKSVFRPLGMSDSSFDWKQEFYKTKVFNHDGFGKPAGQNAERGVNAASSLHTTAEDYAKFVIAVLDGKGLKQKTRTMMLTPQIYVHREKSPQIAWGLGWGLELTPDGKSLFHWGSNGNNKSFIVASEDSRDTVVFFTNGANGLSFLREILDYGIGGTHPSVAWLDYERYDSPARSLLKAIIKNGGESALKMYRTKRERSSVNSISERQMNRLGYTLLRIKNIGDSIAVFKQNVEDFPKSANAWDSLGESYQLNGEKDLAIKSYRKSLELDPKNRNAEAKIKELRSMPSKPGNK